jgi:hypothetical protein
MQRLKLGLYLVMGGCLLFVLAACAGASADGAASAVERYLEALVAGDVNQLVDASCAAWEADARLELDSFSAVSVEMEDLQCKESGQEGDAALVDCSGKIVANYGQRGSGDKFSRPHLRGRPGGGRMADVWLSLRDSVYASDVWLSLRDSVYA